MRTTFIFIFRVLILKSRSSHPEMFLEKVALKICSKFTGEQPYRSVISIKLLCNFIEIPLRHGYSPLLAAYFQNTFLQDHLWRATSEKGSTNAMNINKINTLKGSHIPGCPSIFWKVITTLYINIRINE